MIVSASTIDKPFGEVGALFGKRTHIRDAHDRYANQEGAYSLQRIESYDGLVVLASNQRANINAAGWPYGVDFGKVTCEAAGAVALVRPRFLAEDGS